MIKRSNDEAIDEVMGSPTQSKPTNKIHPMDDAPTKMMIEDDPRPQSRSKSRSESRTKSRSKSRGMKSNKIVPSNDQGSSSTMIPPENKVTCHVEVHREKTPSLASPRGVDNDAYLKDDDKESKL